MLFLFYCNLINFIDRSLKINNHMYTFEFNKQNKFFTEPALKKVNSLKLF